MANDEKGGTRTDLSGVTFIGQPRDGRESYHIRRASGKVLGPFDKGLMLQMLRGGKLTGREQISEDRETWMPMSTVPEFAAAMTTSAGSPSAPPPPPAPAAPTVEIDPALLASIPGLQALVDSPSSPGSIPAPPQATREVPLPGGFSGFPVTAAGPPAWGNQVTIQTDSNFQAPTIATDTLSLGVPTAPPAAPNPFGEPLGKPVTSPLHPITGFTEEPRTSPRTIPLGDPWGSPPEPPPLGGSAGFGGEEIDLPIATEALSNLPRPAGGGGSNLPAASIDLPVAVGSGMDLPTSAQNLPASAQGLPASAQGLPLSAFGATAATAPDLPVSASTQSFGTQALSAFETLGGPFEQPAQDLPASARGVGTSLLEDVAGNDDIWGSIEPPPAVAAPIAPPAPPSTLSMDGLFGDAPAAPAVDDDLASFFPDDDDLPLITEEDEPAAAPSAAKPAASKPRKAVGGTRWGLRIALMVVVLAVLGAAALLLNQLGNKPAEEVVVAEPEPIRTITEIELPSVDMLEEGSYRLLSTYVEQTRQAVGDRTSVRDRAAFLHGAALLFAEHGGHGELREEMQQNYAAMNRDAASDGNVNPEVLLARAAYLAATGRDTAPDAIAALDNATQGAWKEFFAGLYEIQRYRGLGDEGDSAAPAAADTDQAEGSGEVAAAVGDDDEDDAAPIELTFEVDLNASAAPHLERAAQMSEGFVPALYWRGWVALETGDAAAAQQWFERVLEQTPEHTGASIGIARSLLKAGRLSEADVQIQAVIDDSEAEASNLQRSDTYVAAAEIAIARMQPEVAIESLLSALQPWPNHPEALMLLGEQFYRVGQFGRAVDFFSASGMNNRDSEVALGLARGYFGLGNFDAARSALERAASAHPLDGRLPYWIGRAWEEEAEFTQARQYYQQAIQTEPTNARPLVRLAQLAQRENKFSDALRYLDEASQTNQDDAAIQNEIGEMYTELGEMGRGVNSYRRALLLNGSQPDARINLTQYYLDSGQQRRALNEIESMIEAGVQSPRIHYLHAQTLHEMQSWDRAIEELLVLLESAPNNANYLFQMGLVYFDSGNIEAARQQFARAWEANNGMVEAQYYIGRCDIEFAAYNEAITSLTAATQRGARGEYHYWLGVALERAEQVQPALGEYETTITNDVAWALENPDVFGRRGALLYSRGAKRAAYRDLRVLLTLRPRHAEGAKTLGRLHYDDAEYPQAISMLEYSLSLNPEDGEAAYYAGLSYLRLQPVQLEKARSYLELARENYYGETNPELYQKLAYVYRDLNQRNEAAASFQAFLDNANISYDERRETENEIRRLQSRR